MIDDLLPRPRELRVDDPDAGLSGEALLRRVIEGDGAGSEAWSVLADARPGTLPPGGYALRTERAADGGRTVIAGDAEGRFHARARLRQLAAGRGPMPAVTLRDWPELTVRGAVEGFYGPPWSRADRSGFLRFAGSVGLNCYLYAPKDDPYHRERWRDPYPDDLLAELAELCGEAGECGVRFVYGISPGLSMRYSSDSDYRALAAKAAQLWGAGIRSFALLFDDVPLELQHAEDLEVFGTDLRATGRAHGLTCRRFADDFLLPRGIRQPLEMCPTEYAGGSPSPYRDGLAATLPDDALVMWTGADIVVAEVTRADIDAAAASYGRRLLLWDNFPVNDFDRSRLFLGPLTGRSTDVAGSALAGILSNPMIEAAPSRFALAAVADWAWNPGAYVAEDAARRALPIVAGDSPGIAALVRASGSWPPSATQSAEVAALADAALDGEAGALDRLEAVLEELAEAAAGDAAALSGSLDPWLAAARDAGSAALSATRLLRRLNSGSGSTESPAAADALALESAAVRNAQDVADRHYANVLRGILPGFVREVLARTGFEKPSAPHSRRALFVSGPEFSPGDRDMIERLTARGIAVEIRREWSLGDDADRLDLAVLSSRAPTEAAAALARTPVPLLAWGRFEELGIASASGVLGAQEELDIAEPGSPLAAGFTGRLRVHRGPGKVTWSEPARDAQVIARATGNGAAVIAMLGAGAALISGEPAPADRLAFFLSGDGLAPWLLTDDGRALFTAAVDRLTGGA